MYALLQSTPESKLSQQVYLTKFALRTQYYMKQEGLFNPEVCFLKNETARPPSGGALVSFAWKGDWEGFYLAHQTTCWVGGSKGDRDAVLISQYNEVAAKVKDITHRITAGQTRESLKGELAKVPGEGCTFNGWEVKRLDGKPPAAVFALNTVYLIGVTYLWDLWGTFPYYFCDVIKVGEKRSRSLSLEGRDMLMFGNYLN